MDKYIQKNKLIRYARPYFQKDLGVKLWASSNVEMGSFLPIYSLCYQPAAAASGQDQSCTHSIDSAAADVLPYTYAKTKVFIVHFADEI